MKELLQALVVLVLAVPFIYMAYDISRELIKKSLVVVSTKAKPKVVGFINIFFE